MKANVILISGAKIYAALIAVLLNVILARNLSAGDFGEVALWLTYLNFIGLISIFGFNTSHIYFYKKGVDNSQFLVVIYISLCILSLLAVSILDVKHNFQWAVIGGLALAGLSLINAEAQAKESFLQYAAQVVALATSVSSIVAYSVWYGVHDPYFLIQVYSFLLVLFFLVMAFLKRKLFLERSLKILRGKDYIGYGMKGFVLNVLGQALYFLDIVMVGHLMNSAQVAYYAVAGLVAKSLWLLIDSAGSILFPSLMFGSGSERRRKTLTAIKVSAALCVVPGLIFLVFGEWVLIAAFGEDYVYSLVPAYILILASFPLILYKMCSRLSAAENNWKIAYYSLVFAVLINVGLNFFFIPLYGIAGAALASLIAYSFCGIYIFCKLKVYGS